MHSIAFANREDLSNPFVETSREGFLLAQEVSVYSLVSVAKATAPLMTEGGALLTLTYLGSTRVLTNYNVMGVAKAGLEATVRYLASELGEKKIRVNAISAGPVKAASARGIKDFSKATELVQAKAPLRRNTDPNRGLQIWRCFSPLIWGAALPAACCLSTRGFTLWGCNEIDGNAARRFKY